MKFLQLNFHPNRQQKTLTTAKVRLNKWNLINPIACAGRPPARSLGSRASSDRRLRGRHPVLRAFVCGCLCMHVCVSLCIYVYACLCARVRAHVWCQGCVMVPTLVESCKHIVGSVIGVQSSSLPLEMFCVSCFDSGMYILLPTISPRKALNLS